jgi:hypothetical protein
VRRSVHEHQLNRDLRDSVGEFLKLAIERNVADPLDIYCLATRFGSDINGMASTCTMQKDGRLGSIWLLDADCMSAEMPACKAEFDSCVALCGDYAEDPDVPNCS